MGGASAAAPVSLQNVFLFLYEVVSYSSGYPHTTTINLSSIVVSDFLPPLIITSLLEEAPDWLTWREYPKVQIFQLMRIVRQTPQTLNLHRVIRTIRAASFAQIAPQDCLSRLCIDLTCKSFARIATFASGYVCFRFNYVCPHFCYVLLEPWGVTIFKLQI